MKRIVFIASNRVHLARQKLLLDELGKHFEVDIFEPQQKEGGMSVSSILYAIEFNNFLSSKQYDYVLARGDRYEILPMVVVASYKGIPIIHIEGGDLSGAIDNKVRYAITHLSDYHFCTNEESHQRLIQNGISPNKVWNFGSLDVEFAKSVDTIDVNLQHFIKEPYILVAYHEIPGEDSNELEKALKHFEK